MRSIPSKLAIFGLVLISFCRTAASDPQVPGGTISLFANVTDPQTLSFAPDGTLYAGRDNLGSGGLSSDAVPISRVSPCFPQGAAFGNNPILDADAVVFDAAGIISGLAGSVIVGGVHNGNFGRLSRVAPDGTVTTLSELPVDVSNPIKFTWVNPGRLLFTEGNSGNVMVMTNSTPRVFFSTPSAYSLALDSVGRVLVSSLSTPQIRLYSADGILVSNLFANAHTRSPLARGPGGFWGTGVYFVAPNGNLQSIETSGAITERGSGFEAFEDMEFGPDGALYLSDLESDRILRVATSIYVPPLQHWWPAEGNANNAVSTAHGVASAAIVYAPGRNGQAFSFDGTFASKVTFGSDAGNFGTQDFTVGYWIKTSVSNALNIQVLDKRPVCNHASFWNLSLAGTPYSELDELPDGTKYLTVGVSGAANAVVADGQWHHLALVRRGGEIRLYRDALLVASNATNFVINLSNSAPLTLNSSICQNFGATPLGGLLDDLKIYACALDGSQIAASAGILDPNLPTLSAEALPDAVRLKWTTNSPGFLLEGNSLLSTPAAWGVLNSAYAISSTNYVVTNATGGTTGFYRLRHP